MSLLLAMFAKVFLTVISAFFIFMFAYLISPFGERIKVRNSTEIVVTIFASLSLITTFTTIILWVWNII